MGNRRNPAGERLLPLHMLTGATRPSTIDTTSRHALRDEYTRTIEPSRALAAETLTLERTLGDLVNQAYALTPAEIALMRQTAPPRMPIPLAT